MPPRKQKQAASVEIPAFPPPPSMPPTHTEEPQRTPEMSPSKRATGITQAQKQALIDNLQLEITERARKLRAQYALQAQGLRARLEMRVNRIPQALRKCNIQELMDEHSAKLEPKPAAPMPVAETRTEIEQQPRQSIVRNSLKRTSDHFSVTDDKENNPGGSDLPNPKKRAKVGTTTANTKASRTVPRKVAPPNVLSPRSNNSRTYPQSPFKAMSPEKPPPFAAKPSSPMKALPALPTQAYGKSNSRAPSRQTKRPGTALANSDDPRSEASTMSAGTTIVAKAGTKKAAPARKPPVPKAPAAAATARRATAGKKEATAPATATNTTAGGRTLRKRG